MNETKWTTLAFSARGRINRQRFWTVTAVSILINIIASVPSAMFDGDTAPAGPKLVLGLVDIVVGIGLFWVSLAIGIKRFHDRNKSGYWMLLSLVPIIGTIWVLVETGFLRGTVGSNDYGPDPLSPHDEIIDVFNAPPPPQVGPS